MWKGVVLFSIVCIQLTYSFESRHKPFRKLRSQDNDTIILKLQRYHSHRLNKSSHKSYKSSHKSYKTSKQVPVQNLHLKQMCKVQGLWTDQNSNQLTVVVDPKRTEDGNVTYITSLTLGPKYYKGEVKSQENRTFISLVMKGSLENAVIEKFVQIGCAMTGQSKRLFVIVLPLSGDNQQPPALRKFESSAQSLSDVIDFYWNKKYDTNNGTICKLKGSWVDPIGNSIKVKITRAIMSTKGYVYRVRLTLNREMFIGKIQGVVDEPNIALIFHSKIDQSNIVFAVMACNMIYDQKKLLLTYGKLTHNPQPPLQLLYFHMKEKSTKKVFNQNQSDQNFKEECQLLGNWTDSKSAQLHVGLMNQKPTENTRLSYYSVLTLAGVKFIGLMLGDVNRSTLSMYVSDADDPQRELLFTAACRQVAGHDQVSMTVIPQFKNRSHKPKFLYLHDENKIVEMYNVSLVFEAKENTSSSLAITLTGLTP